MITTILWLLATLLLAHVQLSKAQHPTKVQSSSKFARVGYLAPFITSSGFEGRFASNCMSLATSKERTSLSRRELRTEAMIASVNSLVNWCGSKWIQFS